MVDTYVNKGNESTDKESPVKKGNQGTEIEACVLNAARTLLLFSSSVVVDSDRCIYVKSKKSNIS